jgi:hypothetical protein
VRDQLQYSNANLARLVDIKNGTIKRDQCATRIHLNCRRGFICRMQIGKEMIEDTDLHYINSLIWRGGD